MRRSTLVLAALVAALDQATKWFILLVVMNPPRTIEVTPFFNLVLAYNTGIAFSLGAMGTRTSSYFFGGLAIVIVIGLLWWLRGQTRTLVHVAGALVIGGAIGNIIDRFVHPGVVDFLHFHGWLFNFPPLHGSWPAFNLADSAIVMGVAILVLDGLFGSEKADKQQR